MRRRKTLSRTIYRSVATLGLLIPLSAAAIIGTSSVASAITYGEITGTVKNLSGSGLGTVCVGAFGDPTFFLWLAKTNSSGEFVIGTVPDGKYIVLYETCAKVYRGYGGAFYNGTTYGSTYANHKDLVMTGSENVVSSLNLKPAPTITGTVKSTTAQSLSGICVSAYTATTTRNYTVDKVKTTQGTYTITVKLPLPVNLYFYTCTNSQIYVTQYFNGKTYGTRTRTGSEKISVGVGQKITTKNAIMEKPGSGTGYLMVASDGGIFAEGKAKFHGSMGGKRLYKPIVDFAVTPGEKGYWEIASDGGIFAFGNAKFHGSEGGASIPSAIHSFGAMSTGGGYWEVALDGHVYNFGKAPYFGSPKNPKSDIVGFAPTVLDDGYFEVTAKGAVYAYGLATNFGGISAATLKSTIVVALCPTSDSQGYYIVTAKGKVFHFGDANFEGSLSPSAATHPVVAMGVTPTNMGYWLIETNGAVQPFGIAPKLGTLRLMKLNKPIEGVGVVS